MKILFSLCFLLSLSFFLFDCSEKESSLIAPDETYSLFKGKGGGQPVIQYDVTGAITGEGINENITLIFGQVFRDESVHFGSEAGKTGHAYNAKSHGDPIFIFLFDYMEDVGGYQGRFRCEGNFEKKAPM